MSLIIKSYVKYKCCWTIQRNSFSDVCKLSGNLTFDSRTTVRIEVSTHSVVFKCWLWMPILFSPFSEIICLWLLSECKKKELNVRFEWFNSVLNWKSSQFHANKDFIYKTRHIESVRMDQLPRFSRSLRTNLRLDIQRNTNYQTDQVVVNLWHEENERAK